MRGGARGYYGLPPQCAHWFAMTILGYAVRGQTGRCGHRPLRRIWGAGGVRRSVGGGTHGCRPTGDNWEGAAKSGGVEPPPYAEVGGAVQKECGLPRRCAPRNDRVFGRTEASAFFVMRVRRGPGRRGSLCRRRRRGRRGRKECRRRWCFAGRYSRCRRKSGRGAG